VEADRVEAVDGTPLLPVVLFHVERLVVERVLRDTLDELW